MKRPSIAKSGSRGFTLVELVIASILLAIVVTGIAFFFMHIIKLSDEVDDQTRALEICREGIEMLRTQDVLAMPEGWQSPETVGKFTRAIWLDSPYDEYPEAKHVLCRITWNGAEGADSISLSTIF